MDSYYSKVLDTLKNILLYKPEEIVNCYVVIQILLYREQI